MKKGFTLVEMLAVIALIVVIIGFATPAIMNKINSEKNKLSSALEASVKAAADFYVRNNIYGDHMEHYIKFKTLVDNDLLDSTILKDYANYCVKATYVSNQYEFEVVTSCVEG